MYTRHEAYTNWESYLYLSDSVNIEKMEITLERNKFTPSMTKTLIILQLLLIPGLTVSCSSTPNRVSDENSILPGTVERLSNDVFGINGENIPIRISPDEKSKKVINQKGTETLGKTQYCKVDYSTKVVVLETKGDWSKIKVVEPNWLSESHIGWIPSKYLITKDEEEKQSLGKLNSNEYEIIKTDHNQAVENFHVLLKHPHFDKNFIYQFTKQFRKEHCTRNCNVCVYDSKSILPLVDVYPLVGKDYIKLADHFLSMSTFDAPDVRDWYPYQDIKYKEYGGRNWKKEPVK